MNLCDIHSFYDRRSAESPARYTKRGKTKIRFWDLSDSADFSKWGNDLSLKKQT